MKITTNLFRALREAKVLPAILLAIVIILALSYMVFQQSLLMQADLDSYHNVLALGWFTVIERFLKGLNEIVVVHIMHRYRLVVERLLVESFVALSPSSLLLDRQNTAALKNAASRALESLVENGLTVITPIVLLISRSAALSTILDGMQLLIMVACLASVFLAGSAILAYDHQKKEALSKKETEVGEQVRSLMSSIATIVINGAGRLLPPWITELKKDETSPRTKHEVVMGFLYGFLEIATTSIPVALVWVLKGKDAFLPLYIIIQPMFWNTWYLFWTVKSLVVSTAPWAQYAEFIASSLPPPTNLETPISPQVMMPVFGNTEIDEVELIGPSGCGKTTLMRKIIAEICNKFVLGYILYIDQFACLPSGLLIYEYYASAFSEGHVPEDFEEELLKRAELLGIANIVNKDTLKKPFSQPSGGEKKRIIFLKEFLPILMGHSKIEIAFLDEVSAGLDEISFSKVREFIEEAKSKGLKVVSIDHHEHKGNGILEVEVFKRVVPIPPKSKPKVLSLWQKMMVKFFPHVYHREDDEKDLEMGVVETKVEVWAPGLGIVEPRPPV